MARQVIDTNPPMGDPAPTAFEKCNLNFAELYTGVASASANASAAQSTAITAQATANAALPATATTSVLNTNQLRINTGAIASGQYQGHFPLYVAANPGNNSDVLQAHYYRDDASGNGWANFNWRIGRYVDGQTISLVQFTKDNSIALIAGSSRFNFNQNGNATAPGSFVNGGSDPAIKDPQSLRPVVGATEALRGLNVRIGRYLEEFNPDGLDRAFVMADDAMREHTPEVIIEDVIDGQYAGWATDQLIAYLVAAHEEGCQREAVLQARLLALEACLADPAETEPAPEQPA